MLLASQDGNELELSVVGYQFPEVDSDPWDSNWLLIALRVVSPKGSWEVVDPCLTTWEAKRLMAWMLNVAAHDPASAPIAFTEPNLTFTAKPKPRSLKRVLLGACFQLELRPPWLGKGGGGSGDLRVDLDVARSDVARGAASLLGDLIRFPQRGADPTL